MSVDFTTKDSGARREFATGSRRDVREGKGRFDLLPYHAIRRLAGLYERGSVKYGDRNWERGQDFQSYCDSMIRHAFQAAAGYTDEDHFAAVAWNALAVIDHQERIRRGELPTELDNLPRPKFASADEVLDDPEPEPAPTATSKLLKALRGTQWTDIGEGSWLLHNDGQSHPIHFPDAIPDESAADAIERLARRADQVEAVNASTHTAAHTARISISAGQE